MLVEGISDRAAIIASAAMDGVDLEALGIAVLSVDGKTKLDRPTAIFTALNIPCFVIWDCDRRADGIHGLDQNRALQSLLGVPSGAVVDAATKIAETFACFETKLETIIKDEIGLALYQQQLDLVKTVYGIERNDDAEKAPFVMRELLNGAASQGKQCSTLSNIVKSILKMREVAVLSENNLVEVAT